MKCGRGEIMKSGERVWSSVRIESHKCAVVSWLFLDRRWSTDQSESVAIDRMSAGRSDDYQAAKYNRKTHHHHRHHHRYHHHYHYRRGGHPPLCRRRSHGTRARDRNRTDRDDREVFVNEFYHYLWGNCRNEALCPWHTKRRHAIGLRVAAAGSSRWFTEFFFRIFYSPEVVSSSLVYWGF